MSDPEDDEVLLEEIKALEDILAADEASDPTWAQHNLNDSARRGNVSSRGFGEVTPHYESQAQDRKSPRSDPQDALDVNRQLIELLQESKADLMAMLEKCIENKQLVEERINQRSKNTRSSKILVGSAGMPYFKDRYGFAAPRNDDALTKTKNGELQVVHLRYTSPWTVKDRNVLWKAIRQEASSAVLDTEQVEEVASDQANNGKTAKGLLMTKLNLPKNFKAMVGPLGSREFDWMRIATRDFDNRHTAEECRVMWRVFLHPDINRYRWTKEEDSRITELSTELNHQDWDLLASKLATGRSGYQCFIRFNTRNQCTTMKESAWSKREDKHLQLCVEKFQIGHYVPWGSVAMYMTGRTKMQIYFRWQYRTAPHLKKGRFTPEEDTTLLEAVKKYGNNFGKISRCVMPNRSSVQLSGHYTTLVKKERGIRNSWTISDDARLIKFYKKHGTDWSKIAEKFPCKTRTQLRHRHSSLLKYLEKGLSLYEIPRSRETSIKWSKSEETLVQSSERQRVQTALKDFGENLPEVDLELVKHFQRMPPPSRPGRRQKYYREDELETTIRKLNVLTQVLQVDFKIPDETEDERLSDKEKQLVASLRVFERSNKEFKTSTYEFSKMSRTKKNENLHFAPICDGNCNRNERTRINERIDYVDLKKLKILMEPNEVMDTPKIVIDVIGEEKSREFDYFWKILSFGKLEEKKAKVVRNIYVLGPEMYGKNVVTVAEDVRRRDDNNSEGQEIWKEPRGSKKLRRGSKGRIWESRISEGIIYSDKGTSFVEPNYYTLLGLLHFDSGVKEEREERPEGRMSKEATKAMELLKKRMMQIFKYSVGMSHILKPEEVEREHEDVEEGGRLLEEIRTSEEPPVKKKRMSEAGRKNNNKEK